MSDQQIIPYTGSVPGADSNTYTLFDSVAFRAASRGPIRFGAFARYVLALKNSGVGTLKAYASKDGGANYIQFYEIAIPVSTVQRMNQIALMLEPHLDVRIDWVNGGAAQATWYAGQSLDDGVAPLRTIFLDAAGDTDPADAQNVTTVQLPSSLGPKAKSASLSIALASDQVGQQTSALSLSTVAASDSVERNAAALRAPLRNEILVFALTGASVAYNVPDASIGSQPNWKGKYIEAYADGCDVYLQFDTGTAAAVDDTLLSTTSTVSGRTSVAPAGNEAWIIPRGQWIPIPVPSNAQTFALKGSVATNCKLRTKLAQS